MRRLPELALVAVTALWGATFLSTREALRDTGPFTLLFLRFLVGALLVGCLVRRRPTARQALGALTVSLAVAVAIGSQTLGLRTVESGRAAFLTALYVPLVPLLQAPLTGVRPTRGAVVGAAVAFAGLALLSSGEGLSFRFGAGEALMLVGALASALQIVLVGRFATEGDARANTAVQLAAVALLALGGASAEGMRTAAPGLGHVAFLGVFGTAGAILTMNWAQRTVSPSRATLIYALEPVWAAGFGALVGERLGPLGMVGGGLVVAGALLGEFLPERCVTLKAA